jgi:hypothetical protein
MYIFPIGNQSYLLDRDEKRVGKYMDMERVPGVIRVSRDVRHIKITKIDSNQDIEEAFSKTNINKKPNLFEEYLGKNIDLKI